jgi:hypothetical protein
MIEQDLIKAGHGHAADVVVELKWDDKVSWHSVAAVNHDGEVVWIDAQNGMWANAGRTRRGRVVPDQHIERVWANLLNPNGHRHVVS